MITDPSQQLLCPFCRANDISMRYRLNDYRVAACAKCGFQFNADFSGGGEDGELFSENYYKNQHGAAFGRQFDNYRNDPSAEVFDKWLRRIEEIIPSGKVLDVGSALGTFLKLAQDRGWEPQGVEISRFAADYCFQTHGIPVFNGDLEDYKGESDRFDLVTFWDSIEHVSHPLENLQTACRLTRKGGVVLFTTDNFDCLIADIADVLYRWSAGRLRYPVRRIFIDRNYSFFTEATLRNLVEKVGLKIRVIEKMEYPLNKIQATWMEWLALRGVYSLASVLKRQAQITLLAEKV